MKRITLFLFISLSVAGCASRRAAVPTPKVVAMMPGGNWIYLCPGKTGQYVFVVEKTTIDDLVGKCVPAKDAAAARKAIARRYPAPVGEAK